MTLWFCLALRDKSAGKDVADHSHLLNVVGSLSSDRCPQIEAGLGRFRFRSPPIPGPDLNTEHSCRFGPGLVVVFRTPRLED
uniref:Secreted protein n=1 Tax=Ascaris lumbricoides TaxID=6252 RepID=A0A0M3IKQ0_ASCLU